MSEWLRRLSRPIGDLVDRRGVTGSVAEPLLGLVARMREAGEAAALITDTDGRGTGVLTAEDLGGGGWVTGPVAEPLLGLVARMREAGEAAALITDTDGRVTGVLTAEDLVERALFTL